METNQINEIDKEAKAAQAAANAAAKQAAANAAARQATANAAAKQAAAKQAAAKSGTTNTTNTMHRWRCTSRNQACMNGGKRKLNARTKRTKRQRR